MVTGPSPATQHQTEPFRGLLLRYRGRTGLTQRELAARAGVHVRSVQDWEAGLSHPRAKPLEGLVVAFLEAGGFAPGQERREAETLWTALAREAPAYRAPFDADWFEVLLARRTAPPVPSAVVPPAGPPRRQDWGEAPEVRGFVGRTRERQAVRRWVLDDGCRVVALIGLGGVGKTMLAGRVAHDVAPSFERVYWRSLRNAPLPAEWLAGAIGFLAADQRPVLASEADGVRRLLAVVRDTRCLLVLDNLETVLRPGEPVGGYAAGYEGYGRLLQQLAESGHRSCLVLTGREEPPELVALKGQAGAVRVLGVAGLSLEDGQRLLADKQLDGPAWAWRELVARCGGNGLALLIIGETIRELFGGSIGQFLEYSAATQGGLVPGLRRLLQDQTARLSAVERDLLAWLAVEREPLTLAELASARDAHRSRGELVEAVGGLRRRSLVERGEPRPTIILPSVVLEYATDELVEAVALELATGQLQRCLELPLVRATAKDYVRRSQERLVAGPILERLVARCGGRTEAEACLVALLDGWRDRPPAEQGYGPGNVVNLLRLLRGDLCGLDLSRLAIRQVYLAVPAQDARLSQARLTEAVVAESMSAVVCTALSADARYVVGGTFEGAVRLWQVADRRLLLTLEPHAGPVWAVALDAAAQRLATASGDGTVRLWDATSGACRQVFDGHVGGARGVALSADGRRVASGGPDGTVRLWDAPSGACERVLDGHLGEVWSVALSADGRLLASGGADGTVRLWEAASGACRHVLGGHTAAVLCVALSPDGRSLASGGADATVRLWDTASGECRQILSGHTAGARSVALSADGRRVASGGLDGTARIWDALSGECVRVLSGHQGEVRGVALSPDGQRAATGGLDGTVRVWDTAAGECLHLLAGHTAAVWGVAVSGADGRLAAAVTLDGRIRVWDTQRGACRHILAGHAGEVRGVALSADGRSLASGGADGTVRLWDTASGECRQILSGHTAVVSVGLSADGQRLVGGGADASVRVWETASGRCVRVLSGHGAAVWGLALSGDGNLLACSPHDDRIRLWDTTSGVCLRVLTADTAVLSVGLSADGRHLVGGGADASVRLWDTASGECLHILGGHSGEVRGVALSADGQLVASGGLDGTVRLWDAAAGTCRHVLRGHTAAVWGVALGGDGRLLASAGLDGALRVWDARSGVCARTLRPDRLYERMTITGLRGLTAAQHAALLALGAQEPG